MKKVLMFCALSLIAGIAFADIGIDLKNNGGIVYAAGSSTTFVDQALVQLIWSPTNLAQATDVSVDSYLSPGEKVLYSLITTSGFAGTWSDQYPGILEFMNADVGGSDINVGYFFVRIFDNTKLGVNDFYLQQYVQGPNLTEYAANPPPTPYSTFQQLGGSLDSQGYQIIPEPAVASLIVIFGGGMLVSRRIFSRKS